MNSARSVASWRRSAVELHLLLSSCAQQSANVNTADVQDASTVAHEFPKTRFQRRGDPSRDEPQLYLTFAHPARGAIARPVHGLPKPHTLTRLQVECPQKDLEQALPALHAPVLHRLLEGSPVCAHACVHSQPTRRKHGEACDLRWPTPVAG